MKDANYPYPCVLYKIGSYTFKHINNQLREQLLRKCTRGKTILDLVLKNALDLVSNAAETHSARPQTQLIQLHFLHMRIY